MISSMDFISTLPIFKGISLDTIQKYIDESYIDNPLTQWNDNEVLQDRAVRALTAHRLRIERADVFEQGAILKSINENEEIKIPRLDLSKPYLDQTIYGQEYKRLKKNLNGGSAIAL